ncbi:MAG: site-2 protease family protein [Solimonas sp.]
MPFDFTLVQKLAVWALPVLFAITVPEMARGYTARALGDRTAQMLGRLSPNPLRYVDPIGTVLVPGLMLALGGFLIGWPKVVPVDIRNFRKPLRDIALSSVAVPVASGLIAVAWAVLLKIALTVDPAGEGLGLGLRYTAVAGIQISLILMVLNLIPLPPLAGGHVLLALLPSRAAYRFAQIERWSFLILLALLLTGLLGKLLFWPLAIAEWSLYTLFGMTPSDVLMSGP